MALSAVLVATLLETVVAQPAAAVPEPKPQGQVSARADEASARVTARIANRPIEVADLRTETSQTFANPDGTMTLTQSARPVRVRGTDGSWMPVDTTLRFDKDGSVIPAATTVGLRFSGGSGPLATIGGGEQATSLFWPDKLPKPTLLANTATYAEVLPGVDLTLRADVDGFTEVLVVKNRAAAADPKLAKLRFALRQKGLTTKSDEHGNLQALGADGKPVFVGASPSMWDSSAAVAGDDRSVTARSKGPGTGKHVPMRTRVTGDSLEVTPDTAMLANPGTEFPVFLDPGFTSARAAWTGIFNGNPDQSYWNSPDVAKVGSPNNGTYIMRSFFLMGTNGLQRKQIISATLNTHQLTATSCTPTPVELWATGGVGPATTWNNSPFMAKKIQTVNAAKGFSSACPAGPVSFNVKDDLQDAVNGNASVFYLGLRAQNEGTTSQWKTFANNPTMSVTYNSVPTQPHHYTINPCYTTCGVHPAPLRDARPTFTARSIDPDAGQKLRLDFEIFRNGSVVQRGSTPWGSSGQLLSWRPATALTPGVTYSAHVRAYDGVISGPWSAAPSFFVDLTKPGNASVASTDYPAGQWSKEAGQAGTFTFTAPGTADLGGFSYGLDQNPPLGDVKSANGSASIQLTPTTDGPHTLYVQAKDKAGNTSLAVTEYKFFVGKGTVTSPTTGTVSAGKTGVSFSAPADITGATGQWRRGDADAWVDIPAGDVTLAAGGGVSWPLVRSGGEFPRLNWDVAKTLNDAEPGDEPLDGPLQFRAAFSGGAGGFSGPVRFTVDRDMGSATDKGVGPGSVNLLTGNLTVSETDASAASFGSDLTVSRTFNTRDAGKSDSTGMFGSGWSSGVAPEEVVAAYTGLRVTGSLVQVSLEDGETIGFTRNGNGSHTPQVGAEDLTLTHNAGAGTYLLADTEGTAVTFGKPSGSTEFKPIAVTTPGDAQSTTYSWEAVTINGKQVTRPTRMLAPMPAGVTCGVVLVKGCRALTFTYAPANTPIPGGNATGDYPNRVSAVSFTAWDPDASPAAMKTVVLTRYAYDANGRLRQAWDPRLDYSEGGVTKHLADRYEYDGDGLLTVIAPPGVEPWQLSYTTLPGDSGKGRLAQVSRSALTAGTAKTTVVYRVPISGQGAPQDLSTGQTRRWGQVESPSDATAVFPADQVPDGDQAAGRLPSNWDRAAIDYLDANGRSVNTREADGGVTASILDVYGNAVRSLDAENRRRALDDSDSDDVTVEAALAGSLSTLDVYSADGQRLLETFEPEHEVALSDGGEVRGRKHTSYAYDEGAPTTGGPYDLVTTETVTLRHANGQGNQVDSDARTTKTGYDWNLRKPISVTVDPTGLNQTTRTTYDSSTGLVTSTTTPAGGAANNTPATRVTTYYSAGANAVAECGNRPEWANLACRVAPGGQPTGNPLPISTITYDMFNQPRTVTERTPAGAVLRTRIATYDNAARIQTVGVAGAGEALPVTRLVYQPSTGLPVESQSVNADGAVTARLVRSFDSLGRITSYTDADGNASTTTYDLLSRPATTNDGKGERTLTYNNAGLLTRVADSHAGVFTADYDLDGTLVKQVLPNGIEAATTRDEAGTQTGLVYTKPGCGAEDCTLLADAATETVHGQQATRSSSLSAQAFRYDKAGRLVTVNDTVDGLCTTRAYTFSAATNRTGLTTYDPGNEGACQATAGGQSRAWTYDTADRVTDGPYSYDALGRTTTVPAADTQSPTGGNLTATYHVTDLVRSITQGGHSATYNLDVNSSRVRSWTDRKGGVEVAKRHHYADDQDNPVWTDEGNGIYTRAIAGIAGTLAATYTNESGKTVFLLANLHGDVVASAAADLNAQPGIMSTLESTEYGALRDGTQAGQQRYGWLGEHQRAADTPSGISLMGVRLYNPVTARFLQSDPVQGGNANAYEYCHGDGVNCTDLSGEVSCRRQSVSRKKAGRFVKWKIVSRCSLTHGDVQNLIKGMTVVNLIISYLVFIIKHLIVNIALRVVRAAIMAIKWTIKGAYWWKCKRRNGVHIYHTAHVTTWGRRVIGYWSYVSFACR